MTLSTWRSLVVGVNFRTLGVSVTVTRPAPLDDAIETTGIWITPSTEDVPASAEFSRREIRRVLALQRADVPTVPRGTVIEAPEERDADTVLRWRVESVDRLESEHVRVVVVQLPDP